MYGKNFGNCTHSVVASYKPSMLVTGVRFPVCAFACLCVFNFMYACLGMCVWELKKCTSRRTQLRIEFVVWVWSAKWASNRTWPRHRGPCGLMDKALVFGTKDCRFESCQGHFASGPSVRHQAAPEMRRSLQPSQSYCGRFGFPLLLALSHLLAF
jgi:hypothetical protein